MIVGIMSEIEQRQLYRVLWEIWWFHSETEEPYGRSG